MVASLFDAFIEGMRKSVFLRFQCLVKSDAGFPTEHSFSHPYRHWCCPFNLNSRNYIMYHCYGVGVRFWHENLGGRTTRNTWKDPLKLISTAPNDERKETCAALSNRIWPRNAEPIGLYDTVGYSPSRLLWQRKLWQTAHCDTFSTIMFKMAIFSVKSSVFVTFAYFDRFLW